MSWPIEIVLRALLKRMDVLPMVPSGRRGSKGHGRVSRRTFEEMTEGELIAESQGCRDFRECVAVGGEEGAGTFDSLSPGILGKRFTHDAVKEIGAILFRVPQKVCQHFESHSLMEIVADKGRDACG